MCQGLRKASSPKCASIGQAERRHLGPRGYLCGKDYPAASFFRPTSGHPIHSSQDKLTFVAKEMGRSKNYRSPSSIKRSTVRLLNYLHKMIKMSRSMIYKTNEARHMTTYNPESLLDHNNDTRRCSGVSLESFDSPSFFTSTPVSLKEICKKCRKECITKRHLKSRLQLEQDYLATGQAALLLGT